MLIGQYQAVISSKRRVAIPKKFLRELGSKVVVARWYENCLVIVGDKDWKELLNKLTGNAELFTAPVRETDRFILGSAFEEEPDSQGRIVIPEYLASYASLESEVVFIGLGSRIEIWDKGLWSKKELDLAKDAAALIEKFATYGVKN